MLVLPRSSLPVGLLWCCVVLVCRVAWRGADRVALVVVLVVVVLCVEGLALLDESVDDFACVVSAECELSAAWQCDGCGGWFGGVCVAYPLWVVVFCGTGLNKRSPDQNGRAWF